MSDLIPIIDVQVNNAVQELQKQYKDSPFDQKIKIYCCDKDDKEKTFSITIASYGVWLNTPTTNKDFWLGNRNLFSMVKKIGFREPALATPDIKLLFFKNYSSIQEKLINKINAKIEEKEKGMLVVDSTIDELSQPVPILQPEEQTINVIDFGYRTIEIITNDHLVLVDNRNLTTKKKDLYHR